MKRENYESKELVMRERAKMYLDKLLQGLNPVDGSPIEQGNVIFNPKVRNCFQFLADYLEDINGKERRRLDKVRRVLPFDLNSQEKMHIPTVSTALSVSEFAESINSIINNTAMKPLKATSITAWLTEKGFLEVICDKDGKNKKMPTQAGLQIGIFTEVRRSKKTLTEYHAVLYSNEAQQFIADNIGEIIVINNTEKRKDRTSVTEVCIPEMEEPYMSADK